MTDPRVFLDGRVTLHAGDSFAVLKTFPADSIDAVVCDPPYGISFMGRAWDGAGADQRAFQVAFWREVLRVLKPGGHLLAFSANRTVHRMTAAIEDAGFEIRDTIWRAVEADTDVTAFLASLDDAQRDAFRMCCENSGFGGMLGWVFGSGMGKGQNVAKAIDAHFGLTGTLGAPKTARDVARIAGGSASCEGRHDGYERPWMADADAVDRNAREYIPAAEAAREWIGWQTGLKPALEPITMARKPLIGTVVENVLKHGTGALNIDACRIEMSSEDQAYITERVAGFNNTARRGLYGDYNSGEAQDRGALYDASKGRFPAALITDGSAEVVASFPTEERGSAARYFYSSKADAFDRAGSTHPTIKPLDLMQYLARLVCRRGGVVLDPFAGSGTTGEAAWREGMSAVLIERDPKHCADIAGRMALANASAERRAATVKGAKLAEQAERDRKAGKAASPVALTLF